LLMPERHSANDAVAFSRVVTEHLGVEFVHEDISPMIEAFLPRPASCGVQFRAFFRVQLRQI
jgi:hypothetical protein